MLGLPTLSVLVPVYNGLPFLIDTLASIEKSTLEEFEIILIDDGSTDDSKDHMLAFQQESRRRVLVASQQNSGEASAVNLGWSRARGRYVSVLNSDDLVHPTWFAIALEELERHPEIGAVFSDWCEIDETGRELSTRITPEYDPRKFIANWQSFIGPAAVFRRSSVTRGFIRDSKYPLISDFEFWVHFVETEQMMRVPSVMSSWRNHSTNASSSARNIEWARQFISLARDKLFGDSRNHDWNFFLRIRALGSAYFTAASRGDSDSRVPSLRYLTVGFMLNPALVLRVWSRKKEYLMWAKSVLTRDMQTEARESGAEWL